MYIRICILNGRTIFKKFHKTYQHLPLQGPPNYTQIGIWYENIPSGNPALDQRIFERAVKIITPRRIRTRDLLFWMRTR
jgi:hypothetical protein